MDSFASVLTGPWRFEPALTAGLLLAALLYTRGWMTLRRLAPARFTPWRLAAFLGGLATVAVATASPLDALSDLSLQAHMLQHVLLMFAAPPLLWLGWPLAPLLRGLPRQMLKEGLGPFLAWPELQRAVRLITHPAFAWCAFVGATWMWHAPTPYGLALRSQGWHELEHAIFLASALLFWLPVVEPWPSRPAWPRAALIPYLLLAGVQSSVFSALFAFSSGVFYPAYAEAPLLLGLEPLVDQRAAGALMWVAGALALGTALMSQVVLLLQTRGVRPTARATPPRRSSHSAGASFDLLRAPVVGPLLRSLRTRRALQTGMMLLALAVVLDGFLGPPLDSANLAGVLPWTLWRGLVVIALLVAGNLFCMACPFTLPRGLAHRLGLARRPWPRALRSKWLAVALVLAYLVGYEVLDPWATPALTAAIAVAYFASAFAVDALFEGASFCKYVCPIGQFQFVNSSISPLEVKVRDPGTCARCTTHDCIRGGPQGPGCALELVQPAKRGNLDCTFCLDCVRACPHDNVGVSAARPLELADDRPRSGIGRLSQRSDLAALALLLVFGAFANAAGMVAPVAAFEREAAASLGLSGTRGVTLAWLVAGLVLAAPLATGGAVLAGARLAGARPARGATHWRALARRLAFGLVPLGFAMWLAHLGFHLVTAGGSVWIALERAARGLGVGLGAGTSHDGVVFAPLGGSAPWSGALWSSALWSTELGVACLGIGLLVSLRVGWRVCSDVAPTAGRALLLGAPFAALAFALYAAGVWVLLQPMEMRGMAM